MDEQIQVPVELAVARALQNVVALLDETNPDTDVRLQVYPNGEWAVRYGPSDYDQDHRGHWGAASVHYGMDLERLLEVAAYLREQVEESMGE